MTRSSLPVLVAVLIGVATCLWRRPAGRPARTSDPDTRETGVPAACPGIVRRLVRALRGSPPDTQGADLSEVAELTALALDSGQAVDDALAAVADVVDEDAARTLRTVVAALRWGVSPSAAWQFAPPSWAPIAAALDLAARAGVPPAEALRRAAEDDRAERSHALEVAASRLGVRLVLPLGLTFLPAFAFTTIVPVVIGLAGQLAAP